MKQKRMDNKMGTMNDDDMFEEATMNALAVLQSKKGFNWWWDDIDEDIQADIFADMVEAIRTIILK
jgi:hypothetical protein